MALLKTYSLADCQFAWNGIDMNSGVGPDSVLTVSRDFDAITTSSNAAGDNANTRNVNKKGTIEFTLMKNSDVNRLLMTDAVAFENAAGGDEYFFNFTVVDPSDPTQLTAINCWIVKIPDHSKANEAGEVTWSFGCDQLEFIPNPLP